MAKEKTPYIYQPVGYSVHDRNLRLLNKLVSEGHVVHPMGPKSPEGEILFIDHLVVSVSHQITWTDAMGNCNS
jgi:hypothetical protein